jgi:hypothetical protein
MIDVRKFRRASVAGLTPQQMPCLDPAKMPDFDALRSIDAAAQFTLSCDDVRDIKRIIGLKDYQHLVYESVELSCLKGQLRALFVGNRHPFGDAMLACRGRSNDTFNRTFFTYAFLYLRNEDYDATLDVDGNLEFVGVESGLVFLIPSDRAHQQS